MTDATPHRAATRFRPGYGEDAASFYGYSHHHRRDLHLFSCPRCRALVMEEHIETHEDWHEERGK